MLVDAVFNGIVAGREGEAGRSAGSQAVVSTGHPAFRQGGRGLRGAPRLDAQA